MERPEEISTTHYNAEALFSPLTPKSATFDVEGEGLDEGAEQSNSTGAVTHSPTTATTTSIDETPHTYTSFAENFWGLENDGFLGFTRLVTHMRRGRKETLEIINYLKEYAKIEEEYSSKLLKLSKTSPIGDGFGVKLEATDLAPSLLTAWQRTRKMVEIFGLEHHLVHNETMLLHQQLVTLREEQKKKTMELANKVETIQKQLLHLRQNVPKLKKMYETKCKEYDACKEEHDDLSKQHIGPKEEKVLQKLADKKIKLQKEVNTADANYKNEVEKLENAHVEREENIIRAVTEFEEMEVHRIKKVGASLKDFLEILMDCADHAKQQCMESITFSECIKPINDVEIFVSSQRTGWTREKPLPYENYYTGQKKSATFGVDLETHLTTINRTIPHILEESVRYIETRGLNEEGVYRLPGRAAKIRELREQFDTVSDLSALNLDNMNTQVSDVASLLKAYLRDLPDPVMKAEQYQQWVQCGESNSPDKNKVYKSLVEKLPSANQATLQFIIKHLNKIAEHADQNKMTIQNLALIFGPSMVHSGTAGHITDFARQAKVIEDLALQYHEIFQDQ